MLEWIKSLFIKKEKEKVVNIPRVSKKEAEWAEAMHRAEDYYDELEAIDFGEAYNFHTDCGDR